MATRRTLTRFQQKETVDCEQPDDYCAGYTGAVSLPEMVPVMFYRTGNVLSEIRPLPEMFPEDGI